MSYSIHSTLLSTRQRNRAITTTNPKTMLVVDEVSLRLGQTTRFVSSHDSRA